MGLFIKVFLDKPLNIKMLSCISEGRQLLKLSLGISMKSLVYIRPRELFSQEGQLGLWETITGVTTWDLSLIILKFWWQFQILGYSLILSLKKPRIIRFLKALKTFGSFQIEIYLIRSRPVPNISQNSLGNVSFLKTSTHFFKASF